jgi:hypothetical protein
MVILERHIINEVVLWKAAGNKANHNNVVRYKNLKPRISEIIFVFRLL